MHFQPTMNILSCNRDGYWAHSRPATSAHRWTRLSYFIVFLYETCFGLLEVPVNAKGLWFRFDENKNGIEDGELFCEKSKAGDHLFYVKKFINDMELQLLECNNTNEMEFMSIEKAVLEFCNWPYMWEEGSSNLSELSMTASLPRCWRSFYSSSKGGEDVSMPLQLPALPPSCPPTFDFRLGSRVWSCLECCVLSGLIHCLLLCILMACTGKFGSRIDIICFELNFLNITRRLGLCIDV